MRTTTLISLIYSVLGTVAYLMTVVAVVRLGKKTFSTAFISIYVIAAIVVCFQYYLMQYLDYVHNKPFEQQQQQQKH